MHFGALLGNQISSEKSRVLEITVIRIHSQMSLTSSNYPMVGEGAIQNPDLETRVLGSTLCCACQSELMRQVLDLFLNLQGSLEMFLECLLLGGCR